MTPDERAASQASVRSKITDAERTTLPRLNVPPVPKSPKYPATLLPAKYVETLEQNQKLNLCCRHVEEEGHTAQWFATPTAEVTDKGEIVPDWLVIRCGACGRNHIRFFVGSGERKVIKSFT